jgi:hypothetical protein
MGKLKRFGQELGKTFSRLGSAGSRVMANLDKADKDLQEKMKKVVDVT